MKSAYVLDTSKASASMPQETIICGRQLGSKTEAVLGGIAGWLQGAQRMRKKTTTYQYGQAIFQCSPLESGALSPIQSCRLELMSLQMSLNTIDRTLCDGLCSSIYLGRLS